MVTRDPLQKRISITYRLLLNHASIRFGHPLLRRSETKLNEPTALSCGSLLREWLIQDGHLIEAGIRIARTSHPILLFSEPGLPSRPFTQWMHALRSNRAATFIVVRASSIVAARLQRLMQENQWDDAIRLDHHLSHQWMDAQNGTLFVDELMDLSPYFRRRILELIDTGGWMALDGTRYELNTRIAVATNATPRDCAYRFPEIYYRMIVGSLRLHPLREIPSAMPQLIRIALQETAQMLDMPEKRMGTHTMDILSRYSWPGNLAELKRVLLYALLHCDQNVLLPTSLPAHLRRYFQISRPSRFARYVRRKTHHRTQGLSDSSWSFTGNNISR